MSLTLPDDLTWVLNLLGFMWPQADEDKLRACAQAWRTFGADVTRVNQDAALVAAQVTANNTGGSIDAFDRYWHGVGGRGGDFDRAKEAADHMAVALDGMATLVEGVKIAIIAQLGLLAAEIIADQLAAPETLGLSEGVAAGELLITRGILRRIIRDGIHQVGREIVQQLKGRVLALFRGILATALRRAVAGAVVGGGADLAKQELDVNVFHSRTQIDLTEVGAAAGTGAVLGAVAPGGKNSHGGRHDKNPAAMAGVRAPERLGANSYRDPVAGGRLPKYTGPPTRGIFHLPGHDTLSNYPLRSQYDGPAREIPKDTFPGFNNLIRSHVEGHAAAIMRLHDMGPGDEAALEINQAPCAGRNGCTVNLPRMLPPGATLHIYGPDGYYKPWVGAPDP
jgi:hypothetical protein